MKSPIFRYCASTAVSIVSALVFVSVGQCAPTPVSSVVILHPTPNPVVQGQNEVFVAGVNATGQFYPTGTITISDSCAGVASPTVAMLGTIMLGTATSASPGLGTTTITTFPCTGQNTLVAQYSGDANYAAAVSAPVIETVLSQFTPVTVSLGSSSNPTQVGQPVTFNAILTYASTQNSNATGTVTFTDTNTGNVIGTAAVQTAGAARQVATTASFSTSALAAGSYAVQASYSGDNIYASTTSQVLNEVVQQTTTDPTTTALTTTASQITVGDTVTLSAQVSSPAGTPSGTLSFLDGSTVLASVSLDATGVASLTTASLPAGPHTIAAAYGGSSQFATSSSIGVSVTVQPAPLTPTTMVVIATPSPAMVGDNITFSAKVTSSGSGTPTGTLTFQDAFSSPPVNLGTASVQNGVASISGLLPLGTHPILAIYSGDTNFSGSIGTTSEVVNSPSLPATATTITSSANPSTYGQQVTFTAVTTGNAGAPTGNVTFTVGSASAVVSLDGTGTAVFTSSSVPTGTAAVSAVYSGDSANAGSASPTLTQTVGAASTTTALTSSLTPAALAAAVTFTANIAAVAPGSGSPTGTVDFVTDTSTVLCSGVSVQKDGTAACATSALTAGTHNVVANYSGDSNFLASTNSVTQVTNAPASADQLSLRGTGFTYSSVTKLFTATFTVTNNGSQVVPGTIQVLFSSLPAGVALENAQGMLNGVPFMLIRSDLGAGQSASFTVRFSDPSLTNIAYVVIFNTGVVIPNAAVQVRQVRRNHRIRTDR